MKCIKVKSMKVWSNGAIVFENICLKSRGQLLIYEKDRANSSFAQKTKPLNLFLNSLDASYKSKYKL